VEERNLFMNEAEIQDRPVEDGAFALDLNDIAEAEKEEESLEATGEETPEPQTEEVSTPTEPKEEESKELDYTPFLERLSKDVKFMDEEIKINSLDEVKTLTQKGLNYDRLEQKLKEIENSDEMTYIREKAKEAGMNPKDYINALKDFEKRQQEEQERSQYYELIEKGISEDLAKSIIENNRLAREYQQDKARKQEEEKLAQEKAKKDAEYDEFVREFPDVDIKKIPSEVLEESKKTSLTNAYTKYLYKQTLKENELLKQNKLNSQKAPVSGVSEHGGVVVDNDPFLKVFK
jgi:hypothetical protein